MQPYFFPYLGYFDLINFTDKWVIFDTVQYIRHGWINRNRVLHPKEGWQYINVPIKKHSQDTPIKDVIIDNNQNWRERIIGQVQHYKKQAMYFQETAELLMDCLSTENISISRLNVLILEKICYKLDIKFDYRFYSEMDLSLGPVSKPGDWALRICEALGADEYVNPPGGEGIFDKQEFDKRKIKLTIRKLLPFIYICEGYEYIPNLSILDAFMWNEPQTIKRYLNYHLHEE